MYRDAPLGTVTLRGMLVGDEELQSMALRRDDAGRSHRQGRTTGRLKVRSSFGVSQMAAGSLDERDMIRSANAALYETKRGGRNRVATERQVTPESLAE